MGKHEEMLRVYADKAKQMFNDTIEKLYVEDNSEALASLMDMLNMFISYQILKHVKKQEENKK